MSATKQTEYASRRMLEANRRSGCSATLVEDSGSDIDNVQRQLDNQVSNDCGQASRCTASPAAAAISIKALIALKQDLSLANPASKMEIKPLSFDGK